MGEAPKLVLHMSGGTGKSSYAENSSFQRLIIQKSEDILEESIRELSLWQCSSNKLPKCFNIADLGCSSGPNAFFAVKQIIKNVNKTCWQQLNRQPPSVQVFLNDLIANDFNSLFRMLPNFYQEIKKLEDIVNVEGGNHRSCCYVAAVPGSFYGRLFSDNSIHFIHSSCSLHWLSQVPIGLMSESGEPLNKNNIYITETNSPSVRKAYMNQFNNDFTTFLRMRSGELVPKGHMVLTLLCKNDKDDGYNNWELLGNTLQSMVSMGVIEAEQLATFNIPSYFPVMEELKQIIEHEDSFILKKSKTFKLKWDANNVESGKSSGKYVATYIRAIIESILKSHFGEMLMNDLFKTYEKAISEYMEKGKGIVNSVTLLLEKQ